MKGKLIGFASILCVASLMVSGVNAGKPDKPPGKPDNSGKTKTELIVFTGDLEGWAHVEGCCPNAGPFPEYTIALREPLLNAAGDEVYPAGTYNGELFTKSYGVGLVSDGYIVQFHACCINSVFHDDYPCTGGEPTMSFEIIGGTVVEEGRKKDRVVTATFVNADYWNDYERGIPAGLVSFEITRAPSHMEDDFPCNELIQSNHLCP
jgi:hypothetical protein